jgi:hypothetical protein
MAGTDTRRGLRDLISPDEDRVRGRIGDLDEADWPGILDIGTRHRVLPLLHWRVAGLQPAAAVVPPRVVALLGREMLGSTQRALAALAAARAMDEAFGRAGVPALFLKGIHLAVAAYPQPGLRPMRDVDVLVPAGRAADALEALESIGAVRDAKIEGNSDAWRDSMHHLPAMVMPGGRVRVELHTSLSPDTVITCGGLDRVPQWDDLWSRAITVDCAGRRIHVLSLEDLLMHLVVHAVHHHRLAIGPLALADVGFLLARVRIDWGAFWARAHEQGAERGCVLMLRLLEREWGPQPVEWGREAHACAAGDPVLDAASELLLQESPREGSLRIARGAARHAVGRLFASRQDLALMYPVRAESLAAFAWYPRHWWRLATQRLPEYLRYRRQPGVATDMHAMDAVEAWLRR